MNTVIVPLYEKQFSPVEIYGIMGGLVSVMYMLIEYFLIRFSLGYLLTCVFGLFFVNDKGKSYEEINPYYWRI
jgi:hypothetical protein